jgi:hypothetical protein
VGYLKDIANNTKDLVRFEVLMVVKMMMMFFRAVNGESMFL